MLDEVHWDDSIRDPNLRDHDNMRQMLVAFAEQTSPRMKARQNSDVSLERKVMSPLRRAKDIRGRKKNCRRFTREMMKLIKDHFPVELREKDRAKKMARFVHELVDRFLRSEEVVGQNRNRNPR